MLWSPQPILFQRVQVPIQVSARAQVFLNGNTYVAEDTGGGVKGYHIDIFFDTHEEALAWGRQTVEVLLLEE